MPILSEWWRSALWKPSPALRPVIPVGRDRSGGKNGLGPNDEICCDGDGVVSPVGRGHRRCDKRSLPVRYSVMGRRPRAGQGLPCFAVQQHLVPVSLLSEVYAISWAAPPLSTDRPETSLSPSASKVTITASWNLSPEVMLSPPARLLSAPLDAFLLPCYLLYRLRIKLENDCSNFFVVCAKFIFAAKWRTLCCGLPYATMKKSNCMR